MCIRDSYIGGGTPSILNPLQIKDLINLFKENYKIDYGAEITMEVDPASFNEDDLYGFIKAGINRFSLGVQSFNNQVLEQAGRRHCSKDVEKSCFWVKNCLLYTSDAADDLLCVDLGGRRIIKKKHRGVLKTKSLFT